MSDLKQQFTFTERVRLNDEMSAMEVEPLVRLEGVPAPVERFVKKHKDEFISKHGEKKGMSLAFAIGHTQFKKGNLEQNEIVLPDNLREFEQEMLNRFDDPTLSDLAYEQWSQELVDRIEEAVATAINIKKGDWIQLFTGELAKVQDIARGLVMAKRKTGEIKKIRLTRLSRIGKHKGKPAFGFLSLKQD